MERCLEWLYDLVPKEKKKERVLMPPGVEANLLSNVSQHVWDRVGIMIETYLNSGMFIDYACYYGLWDMLNHDKENFFVVVPCAPASCGREGATVVRFVRNVAGEVAKEFGVKHGIDYYVVPCQGGKTHVMYPHTDIYLSLPRQLGEPERFSKRFNDKLAEAMGLKLHSSEA
ncbi:hypothetical protein DRJ48_01015 [Candidatus Woesearchaeota archaeon]|nr:MAG: hypothetical protein DRJ48_01015 [Candidatus Woesearchaeota archaeon]